ncbi:MAG: ribosomal L7Ae/L30e/S12e/Gadd45 family protein [Clostridia bacterium]|nr:ribosomal L7Ae/L30e/S12e/Gadd45 family protein [Clostridia bacterium]MBR6744161.1 ribosomal L7Ae/L30e/S12e/Gadd45 family protein [Clostridia bacterium]
MNEDKNLKQTLFSIGLARKAGKLISGTDFVCEEIRKNKIFLVVCAGDVSDNTKKRISDCCAYYHIKLHFTDITKEMLGGAIGKSFAACVGITDYHLSELIGRNIERKE